MHYSTFDELYAKLNNKNNFDEHIAMDFTKLLMDKVLELCDKTQKQNVANASDEYNEGRQMGIEVLKSVLKFNFPYDYK